MSHFSKYIAAFGVAATLGFAALPLSSYAETSVSQEVKVTVNSSLAISMKSGSSHTLTIDQNSFNDGSDSSNRIQHELEVVSNSSTGYNITLQDSDDNNDLSGPNSAKIEAISAVGAIAAGDGTWGWQKVAPAGATSAASWNPVPTTASSAATVHTSGTTNTTVTESTFVRYGVATTASQASGDYTDTVVYRVQAN